MNSYDKLIEYPKQKGWDYESHNSSKKSNLIQGDSILNTKYVIFKTGTIIFLAYDSFGTQTSMSRTFTGVYRQFPYEEKVDVRILKRDWIDNLLIRKRQLTGRRYIDKKITIKSKNYYEFTKIFNKKAADTFLKLNDKVTPIELFIKNNFLDLIGDFEGKNVIGVETNQWIFNHNEIDILIELGEQLINGIITKVG